MNNLSISEIYNKLQLNNRKIYNNITNRFNLGADLLGFKYDKTYEKHLEPLRNKNLNLCEIGILAGDKLRIFDNYFSDITIYGYDVNIDIIKEYQPKEFLDRITIKKIDSTNELETNTITSLFDIIIDDGCHKPESIIKTFKNFYPKLNDNGIYFIEDINPGRFKIVNEYFINSKIRGDFTTFFKNGNGIMIIIKDTANKSSWDPSINYTPNGFYSLN